MPRGIATLARLDTRSQSKLVESLVHVLSVHPNKFCRRSHATARLHKRRTQILPRTSVDVLCQWPFVTHKEQLHPGLQSSATTPRQSGPHADRTCHGR